MNFIRNAALGLATTLAVLAAPTSASAQSHNGKSKAASATDGGCGTACRQSKAVAEARKPFDQALANGSWKPGGGPMEILVKRRNEALTRQARESLEFNQKNLRLFDGSRVLAACETFYDRRSAILGAPRMESSCGFYRTQRQRYVEGIAAARKMLSLPEDKGPVNAGFERTVEIENMKLTSGETKSKPSGGVLPKGGTANLCLSSKELQRILASVLPGRNSREIERQRARIGKQNLMPNYYGGSIEEEYKRFAKLTSELGVCDEQTISDIISNAHTKRPPEEWRALYFNCSARCRRKAGVTKWFSDAGMLMGALRFEFVEERGESNEAWHERWTRIVGWDTGR